MRAGILLLFIVVVVACTAQVLPVGDFTAPAAGPIVRRAVVGTTVANCGAVIAGQTQECLVNDGLYISDKGGIWIRLQPSVAVVTPIDINGKIGTKFTITANAPAANINVGVQ